MLGDLTLIVRELLFQTWGLTREIQKCSPRFRLSNTPDLITKISKINITEVTTQKTTPLFIKKNEKILSLLNNGTMNFTNSFAEEMNF